MMAGLQPEATAAGPPDGPRRERRRPVEAAGTSRYFDSRAGVTTVKVFPGEHYVTCDPVEMLVTVLGSCVAACVRDPNLGLGGMNHFMLPESEDGIWGGTSAALRYGDHAMETLLNAILSAGCRREDLEIKVFGGANVSRGSVPIGFENAAFVEKYLKNEGLRIEASDLGGNSPRRIHYFPSTGKVRRLLMQRAGDAAVFREEQRLKIQLSETQMEGDTELFTGGN